MNSTVVIVNPKAGHGRAGSKWSEIAPKCAFFGPFDEIYSKRSGHIEELTRECLKKGAQRIVIAGGDGSLSEALNGFFENDKPIRDDAILGSVPLGTGSDFLKTFDISNVDQAIEAFKKNRITSIDIGEIKSLHQPRKRLFLNIASFGCSGEVVRKVNALSPLQKKLLGGSLSYLWATLCAFLTYKNSVVELEIEGKEKQRFKTNNIFVCNGKYCGGGMLWGPKADICDRLFDLMIVKEIPKISGLLELRKVYQGRALEITAVERLQCREFAALSHEHVTIEIDGDLFGTLPALFRIYPFKINFWC